MASTQTQKDSLMMSISQRPKIWYLTRSWLPEQTGGILIRMAQVQELRNQGYQVIVVSLGEPQASEEDVIRIPSPRFEKYSRKLERLGLFEDYLQMWVIRAFAHLKNQIQSHDLVFATSGGELGMAMLAAKLKNALAVPIILNLHDPFDWTTVNGFVRTSRFLHVSRDNIEKKYLAQFDLILTSCNDNRSNLLIKYPDLEGRIHNVHFGWFNPISLAPKIFEPTTQLNFVYGGAMDSAQSPELLIQGVRCNPRFSAHFFGKHWEYPPLKIQDEQVFLHDPMPADLYGKWLLENAHVGFVSLAEPYYGACFPSKIFEYINLGLPILGALPPGEAMDTINHSGYGIAVDYRDTHALGQACGQFLNPKFLSQCRQNMFRDKDLWSMKKHTEGLSRYVEMILEQR